MEKKRPKFKSVTASMIYDEANQSLDTSKHILVDEFGESRE